MRDRRSNLFQTTAALAVLAAGALPAGAAPSSEHPDFSGIWAKTTQRAVEFAHMPPLTTEGRRLWARNKKGIAESDPNINKGLSITVAFFF
jgi:hypothetical protein